MSCNFPLLFHCFCTHLVPKLRKYFYFEFRLTDIFRLFEFTCQFLVFGTFDRFLIQLTSFATSHAMMKLQAKPVKTMKMLVSFDCIELKRFLNWAKLSLRGTFVQVKRSTTWISFLLIRNLFVDLNFIERQIIPNLCKWNISVNEVNWLRRQVVTGADNLSERYWPLAVEGWPPLIWLVAACPLRVPAAVAPPSDVERPPDSAIIHVNSLELFVWHVTCLRC